MKRMQMRGKFIAKAEQMQIKEGVARAGGSQNFVPARRAAASPYGGGGGAARGNKKIKK